MPSSGLPQAERDDHQEPLSTSPHLRTHQQASGCQVLHQVRCPLGYNNVRIKEGDEEKATFRTNQGLLRAHRHVFLGSLLTHDIPMDDE